MKKKGVVFIGLLIIIILGSLIYQNLTGRVVGLNRCVDTDGGQEYDRKGVVWGEDYGTDKDVFYEKDYCLDEKILREHYCSKGEFFLESEKKSLEYSCEIRCEEGACVKE